MFIIRLNYIHKNVIAVASTILQFNIHIIHKRLHSSVSTVDFFLQEGNVLIKK